MTDYAERTLQVALYPSDLALRSIDDLRGMGLEDISGEARFSDNRPPANREVGP